MNGLRPFIGMGPDLIGSEAVRAAAPLISQQTWNLMSKSLSRVQVPLQWQGGALFALYKGKGAKDQVNSYRDITVCSALSKVYGRPLRARLMAALSKACGIDSDQCFDHGMQFGSGLCGGGTDLPHLSMRAISDYATAYDVSSGVLFVDLTAAFSSIDRMLALGPPTSPEDIGKRLKDAGASDDVIARFILAIQSLDVWQSMGGTPLAVTCRT